MKFTKFLFLFLLSFEALPKSPLTWSGRIDSKVKEYNKLHLDFFKKLCTPGTDFKYMKLLKSYRGNGYYLPVLKDEEVDLATIKNFLYEFKLKINFIKRIQKDLKNLKTYPVFSEISKDLQESLKELLRLKVDYHNAIKTSKKEEIELQSKKEMKELKKNFEVFVKKIPFLLSYKFPVDHLKNRIDYDSLKEKKEVHKANKVFFYRRILEDGARDANQSRSDLFIRSTLDTVYLALLKESNFLSEDQRYDLTFLLESIEKVLSRGKKVQEMRIAEWLKRTEETYRFYKDISEPKNKDKLKEMVHERNIATIELRKFVNEKQAEVYLYWRSKPELMKAIFSIETILFNEVGRVDGEEGLERQDVAQVVLNRMLDDFYSSLSKKQDLYSELKLKDAEIKKEKWLNVLFRIGEFSFTYYYISGGMKIFCPDMTSIGKKLRDSNIKIALNSLNSFDESFKATRYFSRASMLGRINMAQVWTNEYEKIPEESGLLIKDQKKLVSSYLAGNYEYFYAFKDSKGIEFIVLSIDGEIYSMRLIKGKPIFYGHRNRHYFTYFKKK